MITDPVQCTRCQHFDPSAPGYHCAAFPDYPGIPRQIIDMMIDHRQPYAGDRGIQWEPNEPGVKHPFEEDSNS